MTMEQDMQGTQVVRVASWQRRDVWMRGLFMLLFMVGFGVGQALVNLIAVVQFLWLLIAGEPNRLLGTFGKSLSAWFSEVAQFLSLATEDKPFPWKAWPAA
jgi:hypothetical protein